MYLGKKYFQLQNAILCYNTNTTININIPEIENISKESFGTQRDVIYFGQKYKDYYLKYKNICTLLG